MGLKTIKLSKADPAAGRLRCCRIFSIQLISSCITLVYNRHLMCVYLLVKTTHRIAIKSDENKAFTNTNVEEIRFPS